MGKKIIGTLLAGCLMLLSGCIPSVELNERAIVQAIGVDSSEEGYRLTLQIFFPDGGGGQTGVDASKQNAKLITAEGKTIADAIQTATLKQGKQIFYGHNRLIVIGEKIAKQGIEPVLPFFNNGYQARPNIDVMIAQGKAEDILSANIKQGIIPAESLQNMVDNYTKNGSVTKTRLLDVIESFFDDSDSIAIPRIILTEMPSEQGKSSSEEPEEVEKTHAVMMKGTAVLRGGKLVGVLNEQETRGLAWLRDKVEQTLLVFPYSEEKSQQAKTVSLEVYRTDTDISARGENGKPVFTVNVRTECRMDEVNLNSQLSLAEKEIRKIEKQAETLIRRECEAAFRRAALEYRADIFHFGTYLFKGDRACWARVKQDWPDGLSNARLQLDVRVDLDRLGLQSNDIR